MDFCDTTDDEMDVNLQLAERLRINRGDYLSSNQQPNVNGLYRKKKLFIDPSSSSSSVDAYNEPSSSHLPNSYGRKKKRQIKDKCIDQLAKSKRTCLSEGLGLNSADAKHDSVKPPSKNYCINRLSDENDSDFDFTSFAPYNKRHLKTMKNSKMLKNTEKPKECALPYGAQSIYRVPIIESASDDDDSGLVIQKGTLKGGRQSPDKKTVKKVIGRKTKKSINNDKRKFALVFSSSDTDEYTLPSCSKEDSCPNVLVNSSSSSNDTNQIHSNLLEVVEKNLPPNIEIMHSLPPDLGYPVSEMCKKSDILKHSCANNLHNGVNSIASTSADNSVQGGTSNPGVSHKNHNTFPPQSGLRKSSWKHQPAAKSNLDSRHTEVLDVHDQSKMDPNLFSVPNHSTFPSQSTRRLRTWELPNGASEVHRHPNVLDVQDDGEVENFFTANSDTESNSGSLRNSYRYEPLHSRSTGFSLLRSSDLPARNTYYRDTMASSEDEICVVYSSEQNKPQSNPPKNEKSTKAKTPIRRKNGTRQRPNLAKLVNIVSSSPDPVEQVRQVEEDERLARMLQAQFDSERDPTYLPMTRESSSSSSDVCVDEPLSNHFQISQSFAFPPPLAHAVSPIRRPTPRPRSSRRPRRQLMDFSNPMLPDPAGLFARFNFDMTPNSITNLLFGTVNDYERLISLGELNGDVSRGLHQREINRLPTRIFIMHTSEQLHKRAQLNKECQVCLTDYADGDNLRILPCFHEFHIPCIDPWLLSNRTCPVCRVVVSLDESSNLPE